MVQALAGEASGAKAGGMTTDELIRELIKEIRSDREAAEERERLIAAELSGIRVAVANLGIDFRAFRDHVFEHENERGKELRAVEDFVGMTEPREKNGGG